MGIDYSSLILKYSTKLKKDPTALVFAPLAEIYIKLGQFDEALKVLQEGLKANPHSLSGYICLAECYIAKSEYELARATLEPLVGKYCENLKLQRLYADACYQIGEYAKALDAYKRILFFNPRDNEISLLVKKLEDYIGNPIVLDEQEDMIDVKSDSPLFPVDNLKLDDDLGQWVQMDTVPKTSNTSSLDDTGLQLRESSADNSDNTVSDDLNCSVTETTPIFTRSLLNLYISQALWSKAKIVVNSLLLENKNQQEQDELYQLRNKINRELEVEIKNSSSSGDQLMTFFDQNIVAAGKPIKTSREAKLLKFLSKIRDEARSNK